MTAVLVASGITKKFAGIAALIDAGLSVEEGERVGLIGPNGAGKTTLFNCILGVTPIDGGTVTFDGRDVTADRVDQRARAGIGRTFQRIELFADSTVLDHLLIAERVRNGSGRFWKDLLGLGRPTAAERERADEVLTLLGLEDLAAEPVERLSLGQCRLLEVGRALMTQPKLLLLDEPSSGLDRAETAALAGTLREVQQQQGFAILLVEHDVDLVRSFTTRSYVLDFGHIVSEGPTAEVLASDVVRSAYLGDMEVPT